MPTIAHGPSQVLGRASHRLTIWIVGAILVAVVATALALSLSASGVQQTGPSADSPQAAPQAPTPFGGAHQADPGASAPQAAPQPATQWGGARP